MAYFFGPTQLEMDPESPSAAIQNNPTAMIRPGTTVAKNNRIYMYVQFDAAGTPPPAGGLVYLRSVQTWNPAAGLATVTNGALGITTAGNYSLAAGMLHLGVLMPGNYGYIQTRGESFVMMRTNPASPNVGTLMVANLTNAADPSQAIPATGVNILATNHVAYIRDPFNPPNAILIFDLS